MSVTSYTAGLDGVQAGRLRAVLAERGFEFVERAHALYAARKGKLQVTVYAKGPKVLVQGKEAGEFVRFVLEPEVQIVGEE